MSKWQDLLKDMGNAFQYVEPFVHLHMHDCVHIYDHFCIYMYIYILYEHDFVEHVEYYFNIMITNTFGYIPQYMHTIQIHRRCMCIQVPSLGAGDIDNWSPQALVVRVLFRVQPLIA